MQLRDAGFGHPEDLPDLFQGQAFVVVEADDDALPLGQPVDGVGQDLFDRLAVEGAGGIGAAASSIVSIRVTLSPSVP